MSRLFGFFKPEWKNPAITILGLASASAFTVVAGARFAELIYANQKAHKEAMRKKIASANELHHQNPIEETHPPQADSFTLD